jgi:Polysulphide reductase, NrfD
VSAHRPHTEVYRRSANAPAGGLLVTGAVMALLGFGAFVLFLMGDDPDRAWRMFHVNFLFFTGVAQGAVVFAAAQKITKGVWAGPIIRFAEAAVAFLPVAIVLFLVLFLGRAHLFPWIAHPTPTRGKWLTVGWVFWRDLAALLALLGITVAFVWNDLKPDAAEMREHVEGWRRRLYDRIVGDYSGSDEDLKRVEDRLNRLAPILVISYAWLFSLVGFDLVMSLAPYWVSNLFGAFFFMGAFLTGLTMLGLMTVYWRGRLGMRETIGRQQFHDLGKMVFGFSIFWAYLMFSQLLVIWYGNLPEETSFVFWRLWGEWRPIAVLVGLMVFLIPFWGLIWVKSKVTPLTFTLFVAISFTGVWLERYLLVQPSLVDHGPAFGLPEIGISIGFLGLFLFAYAMFARALPMVSPRLLVASEATGHH